MLLMHVLATLPNRFHVVGPAPKGAACRRAYAYPGFWTHCLAQCVVCRRRDLRGGRAARHPPRRTARSSINAQDPAVNNAAARELVGALAARSGAAYELAVWDDLGKVHDVIDPSTYPAARTRVYPRLAALLES